MVIVQYRSNDSCMACANAANTLAKALQYLLTGVRDLFRDIQYVLVSDLIFKSVSCMTRLTDTVMDIPLIHLLET